MYTKEDMVNLVNQLNEYRDAYYNHNQSLVTDETYDGLFDKLQTIESELGFTLSNSPTQTVGFEVQSELKKVAHSHPMLSLDKTKDPKDILSFANGKPIIAMAKMDGLTCSLHYDENGDLISAETRGNGEIGEDVFANAKQVANIPIHINNNGNPLTIDGEVIIDWATFDKINEKLDIKYSHPRNLASGSIRQLDTQITKSRELKFIAWRVIEGINENIFSDSLKKAGELGFDVVPYVLDVMPTLENIEHDIKTIQNNAKINNYPIDGIVFSYADMAYGDSLGKTAHHICASYAFKFYDETYETKLLNVEWSTTRTGSVNPVAIFEPVEIDGANVSRATLHNVSIMKELELGIGDTITVFKANAIIPKVNDNLTRSNTYTFPTVCPCCGAPVNIKQDGIAEVMYCSNPDCSAKKLSKFVYFVSKEGMDIKGLSESTLEKLIGEGLIKTYADIYHLKDHRDILISLEGFREKSADKLLNAIEDSRAVKLDKFITALGIPNIGKVAAKTLSKSMNESYDNFMAKLYDGISLSGLEDFGSVMEDSIYEWYNNRPEIEKDIELELHFMNTKNVKGVNNNFINGKTFVITGKFSKPRSYYEEYITNHGGKLTGSVSKNTDYLLTDNPDSGSTKAKKAIELNIPVLSEEEFIKKIQNNI